MEHLYKVADTIPVSLATLKKEEQQRLDQADLQRRQDQLVRDFDIQAAVRDEDTAHRVEASAPGGAKYARNDLVPTTRVGRHLRHVGEMVSPSGVGIPTKRGTPGNLGFGSQPLTPYPEGSADELFEHVQRQEAVEHADNLDKTARLQEKLRKREAMRKRFLADEEAYDAKHNPPGLRYQRLSNNDLTTP